ATIERRIRRLIAASELPRRGVCLCCGEERATGVASVQMECERAQTQTRVEVVPGSMKTIPGIVTTWEETHSVEVFGHNTEVPTPICLCPGCRARLFAP